MSYTRQENDNGLDAKSVEIAAPMRQHPAPVCQFSEAVQNIFGASIIEDYHQMQDAMAEFKMFCWQTSPEKNEGPSEGSLWHLVGETKESLIILRDEMVIYAQHEQSNLIELQRAFEDFQTNIKLMEERLELSKAIENRAQTNMNIGSVV
ncbi:MAG: hypothetical protein K0S63_973, partial [Gammaproteobacteria bacterium]|nr:hypothetical protein [Gammaproteobacteria bacterium]